MTLRPFLLILTFVATATMAATATSQDYPAPIEALQQRGVRIVGTFEVPGGLTGYAGIANHQPLALYVTADGQRVIVGSMLNAQGEFLHQDTLRQMVSGPMSERIWTQLKHSTWVAEGASDAPRTVYVFSDPNCPFCYRFWKQAQPWLKSGRVELRHVIVGVISKTSDNKAARILTAANPEHMLVKNKKLYPEGGIEPMTKVPAEIKSKLIANLRLMHQLGLRGTPSLVYRDEQGHVQFWRGVPPQSAMTRIFGQR